MYIQVRSQNYAEKRSPVPMVTTQQMLARKLNEYLADGIMGRKKQHKGAVVEALSNYNLCKTKKKFFLIITIFRNFNQPLCNVPTY